MLHKKKLHNKLLEKCQEVAIGKVDSIGHIEDERWNSCHGC